MTAIVAERDGALAGVAMASGGIIHLLYVDPDHRFAGVSAALLAALEATIAETAAEGSLRTTKTARDFYLARGWAATECGAPDRLTKRLRR